MAKDSNTLHLVLKRKWWDMIESGVKKEEYRTQSEYWVKRLVDGPRFKPYEHVCFHLGYTSTTMTFSILRISQGDGIPEWGGGHERVFIISLGARVK